ncbi:dihydrofolate reductase family protein [Actinoplanes sichuanensis]|uniref:Dihydrofolate reductase family protein n=1 Tax=Actinoplanes sichuanensis TaxID=512349 RepID=A0ABW4A5L5_9ACTN|nr:dihydrofolate reductase family protein [Actinoplanes sichuanensis]BEL03221.1 dihydrofolate reductase family protein [Actinoplanes sichuanensis]
MAFVTASISVSADGFVAGVNLSAEKPFGDGPVDELHRWMFETPEENRAELDEIVAADAFIMGRNMFGPIRGEWDMSWQGWWGDEPPYHKPVFVLTHHAREDLPMAGGTTFHFVTGGIHEAFDQARKATGDGHIAIAGGAATVNQFLAAGLIDQLSLQITPVVLGAGQRLFDGVPVLKLEQIGSRSASLTTHIKYRVVR